MPPCEMTTAKKMPTDSSVAIHIGTLSNQLPTKPTWPICLLTCLLTLWFNPAGSYPPRSRSLTPPTQWDGERIKKK